MASKVALLLVALCIGAASAGAFRKCDRLHHVVALPFIAPNVADIGKCPPGCEAATFSPMQIIYMKDGEEEIQNEENSELVIETCKPARRH